MLTLVSAAAFEQAESASLLPPGAFDNNDNVVGLQSGTQRALLDSRGLALQAGGLQLNALGLLVNCSGGVAAASPTSSSPSA